MAVSRPLRRLLRIRDLQEEQSRVALETAIGDLHRLEGALAAAGERGKLGQRLFQTGACAGDLPNRLSGIEETHAAERYAGVLTPRIAAQKEDVADLRQEYLEKRMERRQAETLIEEAEALEALDATRRSQVALDDWYSSRKYQLELKEGNALPAAIGLAVSEPATPKSESAAKNTLVKKIL